MWKALTADSILPYALLGMTAVTGLVDAVSFLSLGHVFTANMTGNIVLLAFASTGVPQVSLARSITALLGFLAGAAVGVVDQLNFARPGVGLPGSTSQRSPTLCRRAT
jgi:uncharacterized membrane protein YoaK (UPF0700 family)